MTEAEPQPSKVPGSASQRVGRGMESQVGETSPGSGGVVVVPGPVSGVVVPGPVEPGGMVEPGGGVVLPLPSPSSPQATRPTNIEIKRQFRMDLDKGASITAEKG